MSKRLKITFITVTTIAVFAAGPSLLAAQSAEEQPSGHQHMHGHMESGEAVTDEEGTSSCCKKSAENMKAMHAKQQQIQAELDQLVSKMNSTTGETQLKAMADLLTKLVEQREFTGGMMQMNSAMMKEMMSGDMTDCPMMKKMQAKNDSEGSSAGDEDHSQHH